MRNAEITHRTTSTQDRAENIRPRRPAPTAADKRQHLAAIRRTARAILTGALVIRTYSPRNLARYGRTFPTPVALRVRVGEMRVEAPLGQRRRVICRGAERQSWVELRAELRTRHAAAAIQRRRAARTRRVL